MISTPVLDGKKIRRKYLEMEHHLSHMWLQGSQPNEDGNLSDSTVRRERKQKNPSP